MMSCRRSAMAAAFGRSTSADKAPPQAAGLAPLTRRDPPPRRMQCRASNKSSFEKEVAEAGGAVSPGGAKKRASGGSKAAQKAKIADERSTDGFPGADDFFEGEKWEWLGFVTQYYYSASLAPSRGRAAAKQTRTANDHTHARNDTQSSSSSSPVRWAALQQIPTTTAPPALWNRRRRRRRCRSSTPRSCLRPRARRPSRPSESAIVTWRTCIEHPLPSESPS